jgi:hypothetical protein
MRFERYINEKWVADDKVHDLPIYINPTFDDYKEMLSEGVTGYRVTVDMVKKNVIVSSDYIFHRDQMKTPEVKKIMRFNWQDYWQGAPSVKRYFMFNCDHRFQDSRSDSLNALANSGMYMAPKIKPFVQELASHDRTWLRKYGFKIPDLDAIFEHALTELENW